MIKRISKKIVFVSVALTLLSTEIFAQTRKFGIKDENSTSASKNDSPKIELSQNQICNVYALDYSPDGKHLVAGYNNGSVRIWDITTGKMERDLQGHTGVVWSVAYSPDGKMVISGSADNTIKCWDADTGKLIRTLPKKGDTGHSAIVSYVTFNPSGTYIASGSSDKSVKFWDASTGQLLQTLSNTHSKTVAAISYSKTGRYVATASWDNTTKIYHAMGGIERNLLTGHKEAVFAVQFSPDENYIATGSADKTVRIYEVETGNFLRSITGITGEVWTLSYTPDGKNIVIGASDGSVILFDATNGKKIMQFAGHDHEVRSCAFDKQGKHLYTGDSGGIIKMWDVEKGELLVTMLQITDGNWVTWTPDGFLTGSEGSFSKLSYTYNNKKYSLEEIKSTVNRPDIIAAKMQDKVIPTYSEQDTFAAIVARDSEPEIQFEILNADNSKRTDNRNRDINVKMKIKDTGSGIGNIYVKLNGRAFLVSENRISSSGKIHNINSPTPLSLRKGKNTISVSVFDSMNKKEHQSAQIEVEWFGNVQKSRLFVLSAGVDNYTDKSVAKLSGCVNDAKAFAETSRLYAGDLYMNIFEKVLVDAAVTRENLLSVIENFGNSVQADDVFILYLAGHGITHTDGDYYYIPYDFKNSGVNPVENYGVSKWDIINALSSIRAENVTVILDTCNSASFGSMQPSEKELLNMSKQAIIERMGALSGFDLIAACTSTQVAVDNFNGHGVFTACLLDGIKGAADLDQNGQITSAELATYVIKEVPIQSNKKFGYKQEPQRSQPKFDFPMFGKLNPLEGQSIKEAMEIAKLVREKGIDLEKATTQVSNS
nr:caspase family protein [Treponema sp.]